MGEVDNKFWDVSVQLTVRHPRTQKEESKRFRHEGTPAQIASAIQSETSKLIGEIVASLATSEPIPGIEPKSAAILPDESKPVKTKK